MLPRALFCALSPTKNATDSNGYNSNNSLLRSNNDNVLDVRNNSDCYVPPLKAKACARHMWRKRLWLC